MSIQELMSEIGHEIDHRWSAAGYDDREFPEIAANSLRGSDVPSVLSPTALVGWVHETDELPFQEDIGARFAQPPVTLFRARHFYIAAYFWLAGTTSIHEHSFAGAFQVAHGSSLHTKYAFAETSRRGTHLTLGRLTPRSHQLLSPGDVEPIGTGRESIHSLFHIAHPSLTLIVRQYVNPAAQPQYSYLLPGIEYDPTYGDQLTTRRLQTLTALRNWDRGEADRYAHRMILDGDPHSRLAVVTQAYRQLGAGATGELVAQLAVHDPELAQVLRDWTASSGREDAVLEIRRRVQSPDIRLLMGLLLADAPLPTVVDVLGQLGTETSPTAAAGRAIAELGRKAHRLEIDDDAVAVLIDAIDSALAAGAPNAEAARTMDRTRADPALRYLVTESPLTSPLFAFASSDQDVTANV